MDIGERAEGKTRRLLELYLFLTTVREPVNRTRIREVLSGYQGLTDEAFIRQFERDKKDLRSIGIEVVAEGDAGSERLSRYRIRVSRAALPQIDFTAEEIAALQVARNVWSQAGLFQQASGAVRKLVHEEILLDDTPLVGLSPRAAGPEPAFDPLRSALRDRSAVRFRYRNAEAVSIAQRHVQPWQLVLRHGIAYLRGFDVDRQEQRVFRLSRIIGEVARAGRPGAYQIPPMDDGHELFRQVASAQQRTAIVAVAPRRCLEVRGRATPVSPPSDEQPGEAALSPESTGRAARLPTDWDLLVWPFTDAAPAVDQLVGYGTDLVVLEPADLREAIIDRLSSSVGRVR